MGTAHMLHVLLTPASLLNNKVGDVLTCLARPSFSFGAPKQAGIIMHTTLAVFSAGLYIANIPVGGAVVLGVLMFSLFLEMLGLCIGSSLYLFFRSVGLAPKALVRVMLHYLYDRQWMYDRMRRSLIWNLTDKQKEAVKCVKETPVVSNPMIDLARKQSTVPDYKNYDSGWVRHANIDNFQFPMGIACLAWAWNLLTGACNLLMRCL
jgi:hypothetical protein